MGKGKLKRVWTWLRQNALNKQMIVYVLIAELIFWSPVIVAFILAVLGNEWCWSVVGAICVFWANPLTPGWALQIGLAVLIKKIVKRIKR